jgi:Protein of unknown function (DUF2637)
VNESTAPDETPRRLAYGALLFFTVLVATVTFILSFSGLDDYGRRVARMAVLSPLVPIGVDGLTLCAVAATFLLRHARYRVRLYAWSVFAIAVGSSVAGNLSHAAARALSWEGMVGAAAWPILLALASHMVIVVRRNMDSSVQRLVSPEPVPAVDPEPVEETFPDPWEFAEPVAEPVDSVSTPRPTVRKPQPSSRERVEKAHRRTPAATNEQLAKRLNLSTKTVQRYRPADVAAREQINGRVPELEDAPV